MIFETPMEQSSSEADHEVQEDTPVKPALSDTAWQRATDFILEFGTNLQRERLLYHFPDTSVPAENGNVLAALKHYQNDDGGFGHGLEADLRTKQSTVIATTVGLQILESVDGLESELADHALQYLSAKYQTHGWQAIHAGANDAPHAPWWRYEPPASTYQANPTAEVIKYLLARRAMASTTPDLLETAINYITEHPLEMHELLCYVRLFESQELSEQARLDMLPHLLSNAYRLVNSDSLGWEEYCLTPLTVATHPNSVFAEFFADVLPANFAFLIDSQHEDGSWSPNWSWAGEFPATWKVVKTEIKAELTLKNLLLFDAFA